MPQIIATGGISPEAAIWLYDRGAVLERGFRPLVLVTLPAAQLTIEAGKDPTTFAIKGGESAWFLTGNLAVDVSRTQIRLCVPKGACGLPTTTGTLAKLMERTGYISEVCWAALQAILSDTFGFPYTPEHFAAWLPDWLREGELPEYPGTVVRRFHKVARSLQEDQNHANPANE